METKINKINETLQRLDELVADYRNACNDAWGAVAEFLADGPVVAVLSEKDNERIQRELEAIPEGLEREAMARKGGPGYLEAMAEESVELRYAAGGETKTGIIVKARMDNGLVVTVMDPFDGDQTDVRIDDIVDEPAALLMFILRFANEKS